MIIQYIRLSFENLLYVLPSDRIDSLSHVDWYHK